MKGAVLAMFLMLTAAANAKESRLPVPPIPPTGALTMAAPVPSLSHADKDPDQRSYSVSLFSGINHRIGPATGLGYAPGTRYQLDNDRRFMLPGIMLRVPLP